MASDRLDVLTREGLDAARSVGHAQELPIGDPQVVSNRGNLLVHFAFAPVIARVATLTAWTRRDPYAWLAREVSVAGYAAQQGAAVIPPATTVDPGPHQHNGLAVSLWTYRPCATQRPEATVVGESLARLHLALSTYPETLPTLTPIHDQIHDGLAALEREHVLDRQQLTALRSRHDAVLAELDHVGGPATVLHGDAHPGNLLLADNAWQWTDFEETCLGPREWDLAVMVNSKDIDATAALHAYAATIGEPPTTPADLGPFRRARELEATVWSLGMAHQYPARYRDRADTLLANTLARTTSQ